MYGILGIYVVVLYVPLELGLKLTWALNTEIEIISCAVINIFMPCDDVMSLYKTLTYIFLSDAMLKQYF